MKKWIPISKMYNEDISFIEIQKKKNEHVFCIGGDLQNVDYKNTFSQRIIQIAKETGEFLVHVGDITHWATLEGWQINLEALKPIYDPEKNVYQYYALPGNHEWQEDLDLDLYNKYMDMPHNKFYYSIQYGPVYIIMLTTGYSRFDNQFCFSNEDDCQQYQWFLNELKKVKLNKQISWTIVCTHYPDDSLVACKTWEPVEDSALLSQLCIENEIDLCVFGHNHIYERTHPLDQFKNRSANGTIFITTGGLGAKFSKLKEEFDTSHISKIIEHEYHIISVKANDNQIECKMINVDNKILDHFTLNKK